MLTLVCRCREDRASYLQSRAKVGDIHNVGGPLLVSLRGLGLAQTTPEGTRSQLQIHLGRGQVRGRNVQHYRPTRGKPQRPYGLHRVLHSRLEAEAGLAGQLQREAAFLLALSLQASAEVRGAAAAGDGDVG